MARKVSLFIPCFVDQLFPDTGVAALKILQHLGCEVTYSAEQTCCGQPAFNSGYFDEAAPLAVKFLNIFRDADYVVAPSGSCITMVKQLYAELPLPESLRNDWLQWRKRVFELSEFIVSVLGVEKWAGTFPATVTYHDACHALRELRIKEQPRKLLTSIEGLEVLEMENSEICCGFGGTFAVKFPEISTAMVHNKARWIQESGAEYVVSTDSSCLMNIDGYLRRHKIPVKTIHLADLLWRSLQKK